MTTFPITYMVIIIWLILLTFRDIDYWTRVTIKWAGVLLGFLTAIQTFNGEQWLVINDTTGTLTLSTLKDGFQLPISLIVLAASLIVMFNLGLSLISKDWQKPDATRGGPM